jgi:hypothetical protein
MFGALGEGIKESIQGKAWVTREQELIIFLLGFLWVHLGWSPDVGQKIIKED